MAGECKSKDRVPAWRVQSIARPGAVVWGEIVYFIRVADGLPLKQEYCDERGEHSSRW